MLGKRSRSIRGVTSVVSMGLECPPADNWQFLEKQNSSPSAPRQVVGFDLKVSSEKEEETKSFPVTPPTDKQSGSPKYFRPTSGLEGLLSSPRPPGKGNKNLQPVGLSLVAALDSGLELPCEGKSLVTDCRSRAPGVAVRCIAHISESQKTHCCAFGNTCKQSNPIPIAQSSLPQPVNAPHHSKHQNSNQSVYKDPRKSPEEVHSGVDVRRCIFSLLTTSPGTYEGAEHVSFCPMDFMNACFLCKRHLGQGRDIYMYRGDKAFCSIECRHQQIVTDERAERREKCSSIALKAGTAVQSRRSNQRTRVLAAGTAAAA